MVTKRRLSTAKIEDLEVIRSIVSECQDWCNLQERSRSTVDINVMQLFNYTNLEVLEDLEDKEFDGQEISTLVADAGTSLVQIPTALIRSQVPDDDGIELDLKDDEVVAAEQTPICIFNIKKVEEQIEYHHRSLQSISTYQTGEITENGIVWGAISQHSTKFTADNIEPQEVVSFWADRKNGRFQETSSFEKEAGFSNSTVSFSSEDDED